MHLSHSILLLIFLWSHTICGQGTSKPEFRVTDEFIGVQDEAAITTFPSGDYYLVSWTTDTTYCQKEISARIVSSTGALLTEITPLDNVCAYDQTASDVAALSDTRFVVVWQSYGAQDGSGYGIYRRICNTTGSCSDANEVLLSVTTAGNQTVPKVAQIANSSYHVVVWYHSNGTYEAIYARIFNSATGAAYTGELLVQASASTGNMGNPAIDGGIAPDGYRFFVTWQYYEGSSSGLTVRTTVGFLNGTVGSSSWIDIPSDVTYDQKNPCIAYLSGGDRLINGWEMTISYSDVYYRMMGSTLIFYTTQQTLSTAGLNQQDITCAWSNNGNYILAYTSNQNLTYDIYFQAFKSSVVQIGSESVANDDLTYDQYSPAIAGGNNGQFLVVYTSLPAALDGSNAGVLGKFIETSLYFSGIPSSKSFTWTEDTPFVFNTTGIQAVYPFYQPPVMNMTVQIMDPSAASFNSIYGVSVTPSVVSVLSGSLSSINSALNQIVITPTLNYASNYVLRLTINDIPLISNYTVDLNMIAIPVNDPPQWVSNYLNITEGSMAFLSSANMNVTDVDTPIASITFYLYNITHGTFYLSGSPITIITPSELATPNAVYFMHDGSNYAPSYTVGAYDGQSWAYSDATVYFTPVNNAPVLVNNTFAISEGIPLQVTTANIGISDDSPATSLNITISNPTDGTFQLFSINVTSFLYSDVLNGNVYFLHDGSEYAPSFSVSVSDGQYSIGPYISTIAFTHVNDPPTIDVGTITITDGQSVTLTPAYINVTDVDSNVGVLWVQIVQITALELKDLSTEQPITSNFSVAQLENLEVAVVKDGNQMPLLKVRATDGQDASTDASFLFNFTPGSPSPSPVSGNDSTKKNNTTVIVAAAAGGGGGLLAVALLVGILLLRKRKASKTNESDNEHHNEENVEASTTNYQALELGSVPVSQQPALAEKKADDVFSINYSELEIGNELGRGAFGVVYKAQWRNGDCVVKQLDIDRTDEDAVKQFLKEAEILKHLRMHPNVCSLLGVCTDPKYPVCIVMEYLPGGSLFDYLHKGKLKVDPKIAVQLYKDIASGMAHIHQEGLLHCDLAARNLLVSPRGNNEVTVKIADFGLAKSTESGVYSLSSNSKFPIRWTAPEVFQTGKMTKATDVWSFGVVMWEILEQKVPYYELGNQDIAAAICNKGYTLSKPTKTECPDELYEIMLACFNRNPNERPSFVDLVHQFKALERKWDDNTSSPKITLHEETAYSSMSTKDADNKKIDSTETVYEQRGNSDSFYHSQQ